MIVDNFASTQLRAAMWAPIFEYTDIAVRLFPNHEANAKPLDPRGLINLEVANGVDRVPKVLYVLQTFRKPMLLCHILWPRA